MPRPSNHRLGVCYLSSVLAILAIGCGSCRRNEPSKEIASEQKEDEDSAAENSGPRLERGAIWNKGQPLNVLAAWYEVPDGSLAKRRADGEEFTAAHNRLPIGTLVEVTNPQNGKSVRVRVTDRGIHDPRVKLDLCKPAAEQLGIVGKGLARVRMQVVVELPGASSEGNRASSSP